MSRSHSRNTDEDMAPSHGHTHGQHTVGFVSSSAATAGVAGSSNTRDAGMGVHIVINTTAADDVVTDGTVALEQNVNDDDRAMGVSPGVPGAVDATRRSRTSTPLRLVQYWPRFLCIPIRHPAIFLVSKRLSLLQ
ncbi:hypothetical protein ACEPAH_3210 [Sanghuangporus vaninii]